MHVIRLHGNNGEIENLKEFFKKDCTCLMCWLCEDPQQDKEAKMILKLHEEDCKQLTDERLEQVHLIYS